MPSSTQVIAPAIDPLLRERWSSRDFASEHELSGRDLEQLLEAARWSPSAGNSQPWAFLVLQRGTPQHARFVETLSAGNRGWVPTASAVLVSLFRVGDDEDPNLTFSDYAAYDLGQAAAHLTVQAQAMGLGVRQFAGFDHARVATEFGVPASWQVTTGIAVGRVLETEPPADRPRVRKEIPEFVFAGDFGEPWSAAL